MQKESFFFGLAVGGRVGLSPSTVRPFAASGPRVRRPIGSLLQRTDPVPAIFQFSASLFIIPNKDAEAFLHGGGRHFFQAFSTPQLRYVFLCTTLCFLYHISFMNGSAYQGYRFWFSATVRSGYTLQFGRNPPRFNGVS